MWGGVDRRAGINRWPDKALYMNEALVNEMVAQLNLPGPNVWDAGTLRALHGDPNGQQPWREPRLGSYF